MFTKREEEQIISAAKKAVLDAKNTKPSVIRKFTPASDKAAILITKVKNAETKLRKSISGGKSA